MCGSPFHSALSGSTALSSSSSPSRLSPCPSPPPLFSAAAETCPPPPPGFSSSCCSSPVPPPFPFLTSDTPLKPLLRERSGGDLPISDAERGVEELDEISDAACCFSEELSLACTSPVPIRQVVPPSESLPAHGAPAAVPPPPPPACPSPSSPPPPPPAVGCSRPAVVKKISPAALRGVDNSHSLPVSPEQLMADCVQRLLNFHPDLAGRRLAYLNQATRPQLQQGPQCGLVALSIAANHLSAYQLTDVAPDSLQKLAVEKGFSKQGEMFSVDNMACLARSVLGSLVEVRIENVEVLATDTFLWTAFRNKDLFLVPYDCDFNHEPCLAGGRKAHWALLTGLLWASDPSSCPAATSAAKPNSCPAANSTTQPSSCPAADPVAKPTSCPALNIAEQEEELEPGGYLLLLARQSKSLVQGAWLRQDLIDSCRNLKIVGAQRNTEDYVIPAGGLEAGLAARILHLVRK